MVMVRIHDLGGDMYLLRIDDDEVKYFEALWQIPEGITYNAYLLKTGEGWVLFDTWKISYCEEFVNTLNKVVNNSEIKYVVVHHMEPDHSGCLKKVLEIYPEATIIGHMFTKKLIKSFFNMLPNFIQVDDGQELEIGGVRLRFIHIPWIHWPETIATYLVDRGILLSCDAFGSYGIFDKIRVSDLDAMEFEKYMWFSKKYLVNVVGHYFQWVLKAIEKIVPMNIDIRLIAPAHGLIWDKPMLIIENYRKWAMGATTNKYVLIYTSTYGYLEKVFEEISRFLEENNIPHTIYRFNDKHYDNIADMLGDIVDAEGIIIGTSTYESMIFPYMRYILDLIKEKIVNKKKTLIIATYGWGPVAGVQMKKLLEEHGHVVYDTLEYEAGALEKNVDHILNKVKEFISKN